MKLITQFLLVTLICLSCATSKHIIKNNELLPYKESSQITKLVSKNDTIQIVSIIDKREKLSVGKALTGVYYKETPIFLESKLPVVLSRYLVNSFETRNIIVLPNAKLKLEVEIHKFWVEELIEKLKPERAICTVEMIFHLTGENKKWSGQFWTQFQSGGDLSDGTERIAPTLASCMNDIVEKLVNDSKFQKTIKSDI